MIKLVKAYMEFDKEKAMKKLREYIETHPFDRTAIKLLGEM